jgi:amino acid adenylation domain-containing protein
MMKGQEDDSLDDNEAIAIVGMSCRFPGAGDIQSFWHLLLEQRSGILTPSDEALAAAGVSPEDLHDTAYVKVNGSLDDALCFDADFFGYSPQEAALIDPQQRVFLEACWHARENAIGTRSADERIGVYAGVGFNTYLLTHVHADSKSWQGPDRWRAGLGNDKDTLTSRVAYKLGLTGPAVTVQTACSTSLVAVHLACQAILDGDCEMALAGGSSVHFPLGHGYRYHTESIEAVDGVCRPFSTDATGTVFSDGVGVVMLRRYEDALRAGDRIYALIRGSAINNDAADKVGFTAPGMRGQVDVIRMAHAVAGVTADAIDYVEAHGTGTTVGDNIELQALELAFAASDTCSSPCLLGSVKSNIGHTDNAAGIAGLIKVALSLYHRQWPSTLQVTAKTAAVRADSIFSLCHQLTPWSEHERLRYAGVSSFGIGGTNAHAILQQAPRLDLGERSSGATSSNMGWWVPGHPFRRTHLEYSASGRSKLSESVAHLTHLQWAADFRRRGASTVTLDNILLVASLAPPASLLSNLGALGNIELWLHRDADGEDSPTHPAPTRLDFTDGGQWDQAWHERALVQPPSVILYLAGLECAPSGFDTTLAHALGFAGWVARARNHDLPPIGVHWLSAGLFSADGGVPIPAHSAVWGPARVLAQEIEGLTCRVYDVRAQRQRNTDTWPAVTALIAAEEAHGRAADGEFSAYVLRGDRVFRSQLTAVTPAFTKIQTPPALRIGGTYLVTGGAGGIGRELAAWLSTQCQARVIVCGRRPVEQVEGWGEFQAAFPCVIYVQADVASDIQLAAIAQLTDIPLHDIHGVFHCAGAAGEGGLRAKEIEVALRRCSAKVKGAQALGRVFADVPLDFMVYFSSINGWVGGPGQAEYCSANAYLDALAQSGEMPWRTLSIAWDTWLDTGMAKRSASAIASPAATAGVPGFRTSTTLPAHSWLLREHRVDGVALLPGTAHVALLLQAVEAANLGHELIDIRLLNPALVRDDADMCLSVREYVGTNTCVHLCDANGLVLSTAIAAERAYEVASSVVGPHAPSFCEAEAQPCEVSMPARLQVGRRWHCLEGVSRYGDVYRVMLQADALAQDFDEWHWHPALMDVALLPMQIAASTFMVPVSFERVQAFASLATARFSYVRIREAALTRQVADIYVTDGHDVVLLSVTGATFIALDARALQERAVTDEAFSRGLPVAMALEQLGRLLDNYALDTVMLTAASLPELELRSEQLSRRYRSLTLHAPETPEPPETKRQGAVSREALLCQLVASNLGYETVAPDENYFSLGGDSLSGLLLIESARKEGLQLSLDMLYEAKTLAELVHRGDWHAVSTTVRVEPFSLVHAEDRARVAEDAIDAFPLSELQKGVAYYRARYGDQRIYRDVLWADVEGPFEPALLKRAWSNCVQRHPVLRTRVDFTHFREPLQIVDAQGDASIAIGDLAGRSVRQWVEDSGLKSDYPVGRAAYLFALPDGDVLHVLLLLDDALLDGWSATSLLAELLANYGQLLDGQLPTSKPAPLLSFHDYLRHEREIIAAGEERSFWREHLNGCVPSLLAPDAQGHVPDITICEMPFAAGLHVEALSKTYATTPKVVLLASYLRTLSIWCNTNEVTTGLETHTRLEADGGGEVLGLHLNMLPLRQTFTSMPINRYLSAVAQAEAQTVVHRHLPLSEIQRDWSVPLFDNCFNYTQFRKLHEAGNGGLGETLRLKGYAGEEKTHYPFKLWVDCSGAGAYQLYIAFDRLLIDDTDAQQIAELFDRVLEAFARTPEADVMSIGVPPSVTDAVLEREDVPGLGDLFQTSWQVHADRIAVREAQRTFTYRELSIAVECSAMELRKRGCAPGQTVAVLLPRSFRWLVTMLSVLKAGATILPIDPYLPDARVQTMLRQGQPQLVVTDTQIQQERLSGWRGSIIAPVDHTPWPDCLPDGPWAMWGDLPAYLIFTSGSMGAPKGVINTCRGLANRIAWQLRNHSLNPGDVLLSRTPTSFVDVFWENFGALCAGATLVIADDIESRDPARIVELLQRWQVTHLVVVPTLLDPILIQIEQNQQCRTLPLRQVSISGEPLKTALIDRARDLMPSVKWLNLYGSSEASADASAFEVGAWRARKDEPSTVPVGAALPNTGVYLLDENLLPVRPGCTGELYVSGVALAHGYLHQPVLTATRFVPNPWSQGRDDTRMYRTGDIARQGRCGLEIVGRADRQIKVRGVRIDLDDLETRLERLTAIVHTVFVDNEGQLEAYVQCLPDVDPGQLWPALRAQLLPEERPARLWLVEHMPVTAAGKIDRLGLVGTGTLLSNRSRAQLQGDTEVRLAQLWLELLPGSSVHADNHFDELGGHSLLLLQLAGVIERAFGCRLAIAQLQAHSQLRAQALLIDRQSSTSFVADTPLESDPRLQSLPFSPTPLQQAYWVARYREGREGGSSHVYQEWRIPRLDVDRLEVAWNRLIERHGMLRARIDTQGRLSVCDAHVYRIERQDLSTLTPQACEAAMLLWREQHAFAAFTDRDKPFLLHVFQLPDAESVLAVKLDLLFADAWSMGIIARELWTLYADLATELPDLAISFRDVLEHARAYSNVAAREVAERYWSERLGRFSGAPDLPVCANPPNTLTVRRLALVLEPLQKQALERLATHAGVQVSTLLLAAYAAVLQRWSSKKAFSLTLTLFDRPFVHPHVNRVVGDFTSVLWMEVDGKRPDSFLAFARALHAQLLEGLDHRAFNGIDMARATQSQSRAVDAMRYVFTYIAQVDGSSAAFPLGCVERYRVTRTAGVWIDNQVVGEAGRLRLHWDVVDERFAAGIVDDMFAAYRTLVEALLAQTDTGSQAESVELQLPSTQRAYRQAERQADLPVQDYLAAIEAQCVEFPGATAVIAADRTLTYGELWARALRLAAQLKVQVPQASCVAIHLAPGWRYVVAVIATQIAGVAYVPLSLRWPRARVIDVIETYEIAYVLADEDIAAWSSRVSFARTLAAPEQEHPLEPPTSMDIASDPALLAYVMFTSGSSGTPKGVMMRRGAVANTLRDICARLRMNRSSRVLGLSDPGFDLSVFDMLGTLMVGGALVLPDDGDRMNPKAWWALCHQHNVTIWNTAPALFQMLADYSIGKTDRLGALGLRWVMLSGDWIPLHLPGQLRELAPGARLLSLGGATEAGIWSVSFPVTTVQKDWTSIPYGTPLRGQRCDIVDEFNQSCPDGVTGELIIAGASLADGYWQRPELTKRAFVVDARSGERRYRTGDLARYRADGVIELLGRIDSQVKIAGHRIECTEVESAVLSHPAVMRVVVVPVKGYDSVALHAVLEHQEGASIESIRRHCAERLPEAMVPQYWHSGLDITLSDNGKVDRRALQEHIRKMSEESVQDGLGNV